MRLDSGRRRADGYEHVVFDGVDLNDYFEVVGVQAPAFPPVEPITTAIPGKAGEHYYSRRVGSREVTLRLMALADKSSPLSVIQRWRELTPLITHGEPKRLYLDDEMYLNAMLTGETPLEFLGKRGAVEVTFTAFDPYYHGQWHELPLEAGDNTFQVISQCETWPIIRVSGASAPLRVRDNATYNEVRVPATGSATIEIRMEEMKVFSGSNYVPVDIQYTDFFPLIPQEEDTTIWLSSGTGTLSYEERAL